MLKQQLQVIFMLAGLIRGAPVSAGAVIRPKRCHATVLRLAFRRQMHPGWQARSSPGL